MTDNSELVKKAIILSEWMQFILKASTFDKKLIVKYSFILLLSLFCLNISAQIENPIAWTSEVLANEDGTYSLVVEAQVGNGWCIYSQHTADNGPIPTYFEITSEDVELIGDFDEIGEAKEGIDDMFGVNVIKFSKNTKFVQKFKSKDAKSITGNVTFMTCNDKSCLPPHTVDFVATF